MSLHILRLEQCLCASQATLGQIKSCQPDGCPLASQLERVLCSHLVTEVKSGMQLHLSKEGPPLSCTPSFKQLAWARAAYAVWAARTRSHVQTLYPQELGRTYISQICHFIGAMYAMLSVQSWTGLGSVELELRPIVMLIGPFSSGKLA